ncbi:cation:proton antiporter, partial [Chloroflexota bacterium]
LPRIIGYIVVGVLFSPSVLNVVPAATIDNLEIVTLIALSLVAYSIGSSLCIETIRNLAKGIAWITFLQSVGAWFLVTLVLTFVAPFVLPVPYATLYNFYFPMALVIGAIASATAPALTLAMLHEYKAKGPFTTTLLAIVALDDAVAIIAFAIAVGIAHPILVGDAGFSLYQMLGAPFLEITGSIALGAVFGFALLYLCKLAKHSGLLLVLVLGVLTLCGGIAEFFGLSLLLSNMTVGFVMANRDKSNETFAVIEGIEDVVFTAFFVLAGLHFNVEVMKIAGVFAVMLFVVRFGGKYFGTMLGAHISHSPPMFKKYLGLTLTPQAGVAIGLALCVKSVCADFPTFVDILVNTILASVIISELASPPIVKYAIFKTGENNS